MGGLLTPQALARTTPPNSSSVCNCPSRCVVALICSEPGVTKNCEVVLTPWLRASLAMEAAREKSSYEEFVQDPISPTFSSCGHPFFSTASLNLEIGVARSGVNGPLICGSSSDKLISMS